MNLPFEISREGKRWNTRDHVNNLNTALVLSWPITGDCESVIGWKARRTGTMDNSRYGDNFILVFLDVHNSLDLETQDNLCVRTKLGNI